MKKHAEHHKCMLATDPDRYQSEIRPNASWWERVGEKWWYLTMVTKNNPRTGGYFKSRAAKFKERQRHSRYPGVIHPFSKLAMYREICMFFVLCTLFILDPFYATFMMSDYVMGRHRMIHNVTDYIMFFFSAFGLADILLNLILGYENTHTNEIVLDKCKIIKRYARTYLLFDIAALVSSFMPFDLVILDDSGDALIHQLFICRSARIVSLSRYFKFILTLIEIPESIAQCVGIFTSTIYILHWLTCFLAWLPMMGQIFEWPYLDQSWTVEAGVTLKDVENLTFRYLRFLLKTMYHFYGASAGPYPTTNVFEYMVLSCIIMIGICYHTYTIAVVSQLFTITNISDTMYLELFTQVNQYANNKRLSRELKDRLQRYYESKYQRRYFNDEVIMYSMSEHLRLEVLLFSCKHLIQSVCLFKGLSKNAIGAVVGQLKQEIYLPGDTVTGTNVLAGHIHLISYGTLATYACLRDDASSPNASQEFEVMHVEDGDVLGFARRMVDLLRRYTFRAVVLERSEFYSMPIGKFERTERELPELSAKVASLTISRQNYVEKFLQAREFSKHQDILDELCRGKIILSGRKR